MPLPLKPGENIYIDHKIKEASYAMPAMQAAHDHYTIGYMVSGDRRWIATDNIRVCHAGDFGIAKPEVYHRNCPISDVPYDRFVIKVRTEVFEPIIEIIGSAQLDMLCRNYLHFTKASQNEIRKMCDEMLSEYERNSDYSQLLLQGMFYKLFFYVYEHHIPNESDNKTLYLKKFDDRIKKAMIYVENNLEYGADLQDAASFACLSPSHFSRLFKDVTGSSYTTYITEVRLQHAKILLEIGNLSISEVAAKVGISNASYLSALLKKHYGITPTQIKRSSDSGIRSCTSHFPGGSM